MYIGMILCTMLSLPPKEIVDKALRVGKKDPVQTVRTRPCQCNLGDLIQIVYGVVLGS